MVSSTILCKMLGTDSAACRSQELTALLSIGGCVGANCALIHFVIMWRLLLLHVSPLLQITAMEHNSGEVRSLVYTKAALKFLMGPRHLLGSETPESLSDLCQCGGQH
eukprot:1304534-Rhodomonas_salina.1